MSEKRLILDWLYRADIAESGSYFADLLTEAAQVAIGMDRLAAESFSQGAAKRHWNSLLRALDLDRERGITPLVQVDDEVTRRIRPYHVLLKKSDRRRDKLRGLCLSARSAILRMIDDLNDRDYEALACIVSESIGATRVHLTPQGDEEGVDFFALIDLYGSSHLFGGVTGRLRVVGQCKKYGDPLQRDKMKLFSELLSEIMRKHPRVEEIVPAWFRAGSGPIVGWMICHSGFQSGAVEKARDMGMLISDSLDLSHALSLSRRALPNASIVGRITHLKDRIKGQLAIQGN